MALVDLWALAEDNDFIYRVAAAAAEAHIDDLAPSTPAEFAVARQWNLAAAPTFADRYASGIAAGIERPGLDPAVISDADIKAAVLAELTARPWTAP